MADERESRGLEAYARRHLMRVWKDPDYIVWVLSNLADPVRESRTCLGYVLCVKQVLSGVTTCESCNINKRSIGEAIERLKYRVTGEHFGTQILEVTGAENGFDTE